MKIRTIFLAMLSIIVMACSTESEVELEFSCDRDIDRWVRDNLTEIRTLTREQWLHIRNPNYRRAVYAAFTPVQKRTFWVQKLQEALRLDWSEKESAHIQTLLHFAENSGVFNRELRRDDEIFFYRWMENAREELSWSDKTIVSILVSFYPVADKNGGVKVPGNDVNTLRTRVELPDWEYYQPSNCICSTNTLVNDCVLMRGTSCRVSFCNRVYLCGAFARSPCNGFCVRI